MSKLRLTDRSLAPTVSLNDLVHIVKTGDTSQNPAGSSFKATVSQVVGALSASTVTGLTFNNFTYDLTLSLDNGNTFTDNLGILASDIKVTGGTYNPSLGEITFVNNSGGTFIVSGITSDYLSLSGGTVTGNTTFTQSVSASTLFVNGVQITGDTYVTGGTYSNGTVDFNYNTGNSFQITGFFTGTTDVFVTGGTYSAGTITFVNNSGGTFNVTGLTTSLNLSKIIFVDPNGNDSTGTKGDLNLPFLTLEAAKSVATTGDTIYVLPGTYNVTTTNTEGLAKDGIAYYFSPKTTINKATSGDIFRVNGFVYGFNVYGYGNFNKTTNTGAIFSTNNIVVYGSVSGYGSLVAGSGYSTGIKTTTGGSGINLTVNVTSVNGSGGITGLAISNIGSNYKVGDVITIVGGVTPATITITSIVTLPDTDSDVSFEANDLYCSVASSVFDIRSTARFTTKFNNLLTTTTGNGFYIETSNVNVNMNSIVISNGRAFGGGSGSLGGSSSSNINVSGYLISATVNSASAISLSAGATAVFNVHTISYAGTGGYALGCNSSIATLNVSSISSIYGQALCTNYLNGYCGTIVGALNLYGGQVGVINGVSSGDIDTTYFGTRSNAAGVVITISGGNIRLQMQNQDSTTGLAISGGIVTLNGNWQNDDMSTDAQLTGGILIINGDYEWGGPIYLTSRAYGINVNGGTLIVNGTIRINYPNTTSYSALLASPIQYNSGKVILNGSVLISNVPQATPIRATSAGLSIKVYSGGLNTNLIQNGGTLTGKKQKIKYTVNSVINTQLALNDNLGSGTIIFTANAVSYPSISALAQQMVTVINANAIQVTATQDNPGVDTYFYVESDGQNLGFTPSGYINLSELGLIPGMYPLTQSVLGSIIEDVDIE